MCSAANTADAASVTSTPPTIVNMSLLPMILLQFPGDEFHALHDENDLPQQKCGASEMTPDFEISVPRSLQAIGDGQGGLAGNVDSACDLAIGHGPTGYRRLSLLVQTTVDQPGIVESDAHAHLGADIRADRLRSDSDLPRQAQSRPQVDGALVLAIIPVEGADESLASGDMELFAIRDDFEEKIGRASCRERV